MPKKNPSDATTRNIRASKKRDDSLKARIVDLNKRLRLVEQAVRELQIGAAAASGNNDENADYLA